MALEVEVEVLKTVVSKLDHSIEKISQVSNDIGRLLAVHDERIDQLERVSVARMEDIKELHSRITTGNREISEKIDNLDRCMEERMRKAAVASKEQHEEIQKEIQKDVKEISQRVDTLEKWRWMIVGGAVAVGYIVGNLGFFSKFFS
jgi:chromosome segregation ATPase